jgi:hypothetical protein
MAGEPDERDGDDDGTASGAPTRDGTGGPTGTGDRDSPSDADDAGGATSADGAGSGTPADGTTRPADASGPGDPADGGAGPRGESTPPDGPRANRGRVLLGGFGVLVAILGFTAAQAVIDATGVRPDAVLLVLPLFGVVGFASFVTLVSAFLVPD